MTTALLIIDAQNFFAPMLKDALPNILKLFDHFYAEKLPVVFTQHGHRPSDFERPITNQLVRKWGKDGSLHYGSKDWEFVPDVKALTEDSGESVVIEKNTYDGFIQTKLENVLKDKKVRNLILCGVMTDCCVDTTARSAFNRGWHTVVAGDACGTDSEKKQKQVLGQLSFAFGGAIDTDEVLRQLET